MISLILSVMLCSIITILAYILKYYNLFISANFQCRFFVIAHSSCEKNKQPKLIFIERIKLIIVYQI